MKNTLRALGGVILRIARQVRAAQAMRVSLIRTLLMSACHGGTKIVPCKKARIRLCRKNISGDGRLIFGATWPKSFSRPSQLIVHRTGILHLSHNSKICHGANISVAEDARLDLKGCFLNNGANIACYHRISIGKGTVISENVVIRDDDGHRILQKKKHGRIEIGDNVWIGLNVVILKNVSIGDGAIIAAGSIVTKNVAPATLVAGNPARMIKERVSWS